jgi:Sulfotransferase domain
MWNKLVFSAKYLLRRNVAGRMTEVLPDAVFLVSFPKSGNTWTRFLIGNLAHPEEPVTFANVDRIVPDIYGTRQKDIRKIPPPRVFKSHEPFDPRYRRIIYIIRDPRDVAVSSYHFARKGRRIEDSLPLATYVTTQFLKRGHTYGNWGEHTGSWMVNSLNVVEMVHPKKFSGKALGATDEDQAHELVAQGHGREILLLRYEDLIKDTEQELRKVAEFVGIKASPQRIARAVELSTADKMRRLEQKQSDQWGATKEGRKDIAFVREAKSGQWERSLPASAVAEIESKWGHLMQLLGYKLQRGLIEQLDA